MGLSFPICAVRALVVPRPPAALTSESFFQCARFELPSQNGLPTPRDQLAGGPLPEFPAGARFSAFDQRCIPRSIWYCLTHFLFGGNHDRGEGSGSEERLKGARAGGEGV